MRQSGQKRAANMEVCVIKPTAVDDAREITETLLSGRTVILNLEGLDLVESLLSVLSILLLERTFASAEIFRRFL